MIDYLYFNIAEHNTRCQWQWVAKMVYLYILIQDSEHTTRWVVVGCYDTQSVLPHTTIGHTIRLVEVNCCEDLGDCPLFRHQFVPAPQCSHTHVF